jgi:hypothetical protein
VSLPEVERRAPDARAPVRRPVEPRPASALPGLLGRHLVLYGVLLVLLQLAFRGWALAGSWFYFDDIAFMSRAMNEPLDASYLLESYGGHLMPGGFLTVWLLTKVAVYSWAPWAGVLLALQALAGFGMLRLLVSLFGRKPLVLALLAGYLAYVFTLSAGIWFAAGINQLPMQVALVFGLHAHVEYLRHRRVRSLVWAIVWTLAGLVFYEKTLLLLGVYAIVAFGWFSSGGSTDRLKHLWEHYRPAVLAYGALGVGYLALYVQYGLDFSPGNANTQPWSPIAYNLVGTTMLPGLIGGPLQRQPLSVGAFGDPSQAVVLVSWVAFAALVAHAQRTRTKSRRAWSLLAFTAVCNIVLLASARANVVGPDIAREYRYQTESAALFVIGVGLAFLPLLGATEVNELRDPVQPVQPVQPEQPEQLAQEPASGPSRPRSPEPDNPRLVAAITVAVVLTALVSSTRYVHLWQDRNETKQYFANVEKALTGAEDTPVPLVDIGVPQTLLWAYRYPENAYSHVFRNLSDRTSYPRASMDELYMFDDHGRLAAVDVPPTRTQLGGEGCGFPLKRGTTTVPLNGPVIGGGWWLRISYGSSRDVDAHLTVGEENYDLTLPKGLHNLFVQAAGDFDSVTFSDYPSGTGLCVTALTLGLPEPTPIAG